jgi:hypothetical protein
VRRRTGERNQIEERIDAAFRKKERGEELTERDWLLIQYTLGAGNCHACGNPGMVVAARGASHSSANGSAR